MIEWQSKHFSPYWAVPFASYGEVTDFLREVEAACILRGQPSDGTVSFASIARCLHELDRPDRNYRSIHVTGTNGKTTVSRMIAALLQASGMKVGLYTSPHLGHFRERISIDGRPINEQQLLDACNYVKTFTDWKGIQLSPFEFLTTAAFFSFRAARVDFAVIEVGIGGRQDATNVIAPEISVITNIDYDHVDLLGGTLESIAEEKAGIIKPVTPVVCGAIIELTRGVVRSRAAALNSPLLMIGEAYESASFVRTGFTGVCSVRVGDRVWNDLALNSPAHFMAANAAHALAAYDVLRRRGLITEPAQDGLRALFTRIELGPCCEAVPGTPTVLVDGAHNVPAAAGLASILRDAFEGRRSVLVVSVSHDKPYDRMIQELAKAGPDRAIFTRCPSSTAVDPERLTELWRKETNTEAEAVDNPEAAFFRAVHLAGSAGIVAATGSIELAGLCHGLARAAKAGRPDPHTTYSADGP